MRSIEQVINESAGALEAINAAREEAIAASRGLIRQSANAIRAVHRNDFAEAGVLIEKAAETARELRGRLAVYPSLLNAGYTQDALKEYAEARLTYAFVHGDEPPSAAELEVESAAYLNGIAEAASELRRYILDNLRRGSSDRCEALLMIMDEVYSLLITVDYTDAVTGGLRRTTDALRAVLERTRGDLTAALRQEQLAAALASFESRLGITTPDAPPLPADLDE